MLGAVSVVASLLISCSGTAQPTTTPTGLSESYGGALSVESQLMAGSLMLEDTDLAINADQASELLLLWKAYRSVSNSDTAAQIELDAVVTQVEEAMSAEQIDAIRAMQLTSEDLPALLQRFAAPASASTELTDAGSASSAQGPAAAGFPGGSGPGPGGGDGIGLLAPSAGQGAILSAVSTEVPAQNEATTTRSGDRATLWLVDSLITLLETKVDA
jgi:hypothetical protein